jgi:hypothetical protein
LATKLDFATPQFFVLLDNNVTLYLSFELFEIFSVLAISVILTGLLFVTKILLMTMYVLVWFTTIGVGVGVTFFGSFVIRTVVFPVQAFTALAHSASQKTAASPSNGISTG